MRRLIWIIALFVMVMAPASQASPSSPARGFPLMSSIQTAPSYSSAIKRLGLRSPIALIFSNSSQSPFVMQTAEARVKPSASKPEESKKPISLSSAFALLCLCLIILIAAVRVVLARSIRSGES